MIEQLLKNKNAKQRAALKVQEITKIDFKGQHVKNGIKIEVQSVKKIAGGIEIFARAWEKEKQIGFGKDGSVDIERFRIFNPPVLVDDPNGAIVRKGGIDFDGKKQPDRKLREDPKEAILQSLSHTISLVGKSDKNILKGKVGNTISTFYPDADPESTSVDGHLYRDDHDSNWTNTRNNTIATGSDDSGTIINIVTNTGYFLERGFLLFDTSAISTTYTILSATLSVYESTTHTTANADSVSAHIVSSSPASNTSLVVGDYDQVGSISFASVPYASFAVDSYQDFSLNSAGLSNITKAGISKFGIRDSNDLNNIVPSGLNRIQFYTADQIGTSTDPKLVVEHFKGQLVSVSDTLSFLDNIYAAKGKGISVSDTLFSSDSVSSIRHAVISLSESIGITDVLSKFKARWEKFAKNVTTWTFLDKN